MAAVGIAMSLLVPATASADEVMASHDIKLQLQTANGTGCPAGSTAVAPVEGGDAFTVTYSAFKVTGGDYKNCQLVVKVKVPAGYTYAIYSVDNRGYALLDKGASGKLQMTSYFTGNAWTLNATRTIQGSFDDFWQTSNSADVLHWAPCNSDRFLNINNTVRVDGPKTSSMTMSSTDASVSTVFHLRWKACSGAAQPPWEEY
jgi:hypothetical protein